MARFPQTVNGLRIPGEMLNLLETGRWPAGYRIDTSVVAKGYDSQSLRSIDLDLLPSAEKMAAETEGLAAFANATSARVFLGSVTDEQLRLPWVDIEKVLCIATGADFGDDLWLLLDYRDDMQDPCVVANEFSDEDDISWLLVSSSFC